MRLSSEPTQKQKFIILFVWFIWFLLITKEKPENMSMVYVVCSFPNISGGEWQNSMTQFLKVVGRGRENKVVF